VKVSQKQNESSGIAVLIKGNSGDLFASMHAIELAKRTGKTVHALVVGRNGEGVSVGDTRFDDPMLLAAWFGHAEGLRIRWHLLLDAADEDLLGFFHTYRIFCLIVGASSRMAMRRKTRWLEDLRGRLLSDAKWYSRAFWVLVAEPSDKRMFERLGLQLSSHMCVTTEMV